MNSEDADGKSSRTTSPVDVDSARIHAELAGLDVGTDPFVSAVRATRMPMVITNPRLEDNPIAFVNDSFCRLTGYRREEIVGRNCRFLQGPETDPEAVQRIRAAIAAKTSIEIDIRNYRKSGETFWNRLLLAPVNDLNGELAFFFASQVDVTIERERLENLESSNAALIAELADRLREQQIREEELRFTLAAGRFGAWSLNVATGELTTSPTCRETYGRVATGSFSYDELLETVHPDDRSRMREAVRESLESQTDYDIEYRIITPDRRLRWVAVRGRPFANKNGKVERMTGVSLDITERTRAEMMRQRLTDLTELLRDLVESADISYTAGKVLGETLGVDRAGYGTIDADAETITIERDWSLSGIDSLSGVLRFRDFGTFIDDLVAGRTVVIGNVDTDPRTRDTSMAMKSVQAFAVVDEPVIEHGRLRALFYINNSQPREWQADELAFLREVSNRTRAAVERRRAEIALSELNETLEAKVIERSRQLMEVETALRQSQKMEAVGQLTGGLAHDFNNLLTGISGSLEMITLRVSQGRTQDLERYSEAATAAVNRAASLTHRLLAFSRRQTLDPRPVHVDHLVRGMEDLIKRTITPSVSLTIVENEDLWSTLVDPHQLENALLNLCINARDAMVDGGQLTIEITNKTFDVRSATSQNIKAGEFVALSVTDMGTGMPPDVVAKAFDPFYTTKPTGSGTGLGLSMVYGFASQSGGEAVIYSEVGIGTTVTIYLPRHSSVPLDEHVETAVTDKGADGHGEIVLVIDDEDIVRMLISDTLTDAGYKVLVASDGPAGLEIIRSGVPLDLLITDVGLPGLNGRQVADAARVLRPDMKIVFVTGFAESAVVGNGQLEQGMAIITKPFQLNGFLEKIRETLGA